jgi:hypothetical protein
VFSVFKIVLQDTLCRKAKKQKQEHEHSTSIMIILLISILFSFEDLGLLSCSDGPWGWMAGI